MGSEMKKAKLNSKKKMNEPEMKRKIRNEKNLKERKLDS